jgi:two-component system, sensor histidine kinase and response regulator
LLNLLVNANKFTEGGKISVFVRTLVNQRPHKLKFVVKDEGIGVKPEDFKKLFVPFESIEYGQNLNPNGTGLGLSICKRILNEIDCTIELLESKTEGENKGSVFTFIIPMQKCCLKASRPNRDRKLISENKRKKLKQ